MQVTMIIVRIFIAALDVFLATGCAWMLCKRKATGDAAFGATMIGIACAGSAALLVFA